MHCLLGEPVEEFASGSRLPSIEAKGELIEIGLKMCVGDRSLVSPQEPPFQQ